MLGRKINIYTAVVTVSIACAVLTLIVTGVVLLPNASDLTINIYSAALSVAVFLSIAAGIGLWLLKVMTGMLDAPDVDIQRTVTGGDGEAVVRTTVLQDDPEDTLRHF